MFHKVRAVYAYREFTLIVWFEGGESRLYDVKPLFKLGKPFAALEYDSGLFRQVHVVGGGYGIEWNDDIDLACEELYWKGTSIDIVEAAKTRVLADVSSARENRAMSQSQLEKASGVSQPVIARLERGDTAPQLDTLLKVLAPLGKTIAIVDL